MTKKIGILGGGQLARMLTQEALPMGLEIHALSESKDDPVAKVCPLWKKGSLKSKRDLKKFSERMDLLTFESEFLNTNLLKTFKIKPSLRLMTILQDKLHQKLFLEEYKLPVTPLKKNLLFPFVVKLRKLSYDGYGTFFVNNFADFTKHSLNFRSKEFLWEEKIDFKRELAITAVRNKKKQIVFTPLVETFQEKGRCLWVKGPIHFKKIKGVKEKIRRFLNKIQYEGAMSFEFFETKNKELFINEVAPRVHNSCHYSLDALSESQFVLHLKAILNENLTEPKLLCKKFCMVNLLSTGRKKIKLSWPQHVHVYWYGKKHNKPYRKMGHITCLNQPLSFLQTKRKEFLL